MNTPRVRVALYALGGTIAAQSRGPGGGAHPDLTPDALLAAVPAVAEAADVTAVPWRQVMSTELTLVDLMAVVDSARRAVVEGAAGIVITTGTDTMDEVAFALDLLWRGDAPLVLTGAMRRADQPGADGPANLLSAVRVAASPAARRLGCVVVMNNEIHAARHVQKAHTTNPAAFRSTNTGPLGQLHEDHVSVLMWPVGRPHLPMPFQAPAHLAPVALLRCGLGDDGRMLSRLLDLGYTGLVVDTAGGGAVPAHWAEPLGRLAASIPVVYASRTGAGAVLEDTYGAAGCEKDLIARGLIPAGMLDGLKARILLTLLISRGADTGELRAAFRSPYTL